MNIINILQVKYPNASPLNDYQVGDKGDGIQFISLWNLDYPQPSIEQLQQWEQELDLQIRQKEAVSKRIYPSIESQLDMMYHDKLNNTTIWQDTIANIKAMNPKPLE